MATFKDYKEALIAQYQTSKLEDVTGVLHHPTPAQMRDYCVLKLADITSADEGVLKAFFETKKEESLKKSIERCNIDKFKSVISFLKEERDSENRIRVELTAVLINFDQRPFAKFSGMNADVRKEKETLVLGLKSTITLLDARKKKFKWSLVLLIALGLLGIGYTTKDVFLPEKECMQWQKDHYELMDCSSEINGLYTESVIMPIDKSVLSIKKIEVRDTTTFFKGGKPDVWYCKVNGVPECFDGPGFHPITGKALRPITDYIIKKYFNTL
ncbi:hypothetical protein [Flavobacterium sp.]